MTCSRAARLGQLAHDWNPPPRRDYAYVLGMYLGDGYISQGPRTERLRITLDAGYPGIVAECRGAIQALMPRNAVSIVKRPYRCLDVSCYSQLWSELLPQHAPGRKHERSIELEPWQRAVVEGEPKAFIRGLFHSDGSYFQNPVRSAKGVRYSYDRYYFSNRSHDIKALFAWACELIGVETRPVGRWNVSVARRASVARLNEFLGPKR